MHDKQTSLQDIVAAHYGKVTDKWYSYLAIYERTFESFRSKPTKLLEIGIQNGGSLEIHQKYFSRGSLFVGCDTNPKCADLKFNEGIHVVVGDCCSAATQESIARLSSRFDIVIDDGSHKSSDIIKAFLMYFPMLEAGGVYIIEDMHASYWQDWEGGLFYTLSSMSFFKLVADAINSEHWGIRRTPEDLISHEFAEYAPMVLGARLRDIYSVQFFNSVCVIEKCGPDTPAGLGHRVVTGVQASVVPEVSCLNGSTPIQPDESGNPWSVFV